MSAEAGVVIVPKIREAIEGLYRLDIHGQPESASTPISSDSEAIAQQIRGLSGRDVQCTYRKKGDIFVITGVQPV